MVRGPAALLAAYALALAYFLAAPSLPALPAGDPAVLIGDGVGLAVLGGCTLALLDARDSAVALTLLGLGGGLVAVSLQAAHVGAGSDVFEVLLGAALGMLFARALATPAALVALPLVVGGIDAWSVFSGPAADLMRDRSGAVDFLTFELPGWGGAPPGHLGLADVAFLATFAAWTWHFGLRRVLTASALLAALLAALVISVLVGRALPVLPFLALAFLAPNLDRLAVGLTRSGGPPPADERAPPAASP